MAGKRSTAGPVLRHIDDDERRARLRRRHGLSPASRFADIDEAARRVVALHATEPATVHVGLWARVQGVAIDDVERALYDDRSIVKQIAMRRTLFAFPRELLPAVHGSAAARVAKVFGDRLARDLESSGVSTDGHRWIDAAADAVDEALASGDELSSTELRASVPFIDTTVERSPGTKWGGTFPVAPQLLTVLHARARIARGHNDGHWRLSRPRWTSTSAWLGAAIEPLSERDGYRDLVGRWLATFGPGTETDMKWWLGGTLGAVRAALTDLGAVPVSLDGGETGWVLPDDVDPVTADGTDVALLPILDSTTMGWKQRQFYLGHHERALYDTAGNGGSTAWWNGRVVGCWVQDEHATVRVHLLEEVPSTIRRRLDDEAERLSTWLDGVRVTSVYSSSAMAAAAEALRTAEA